jgi:outer membrane murein-binding lipoprotein Lpp
MAKFKNMLFVLLIATMFVGSTMMVGCGGGVDEEQMAALNNLKAEVESLQGQVKAKEDEKASLQKQIADQEELAIGRLADDVGLGYQLNGPHRLFHFANGGMPDAPGPPGLTSRTPWYWESGTVYIASGAAGSSLRFWPPPT